VRVLLDDSSRHRHGIQRRPRSEPTGIIVAASQSVRDAPQPKRRRNLDCGICQGRVKSIQQINFNQQIYSADEFFWMARPGNVQRLIHAR